MSYNRNVMDQRSGDSQISGRSCDVADIWRAWFQPFGMLGCDKGLWIEEDHLWSALPKRVSVEEQLAQKHDIFFVRTRQITFMICDHFRATGAYDAAQDPSDLSKVSLHGDDNQDFETRWDPASLSASETPKENILEGLYKLKIRDSVQLQSVLALYEQETTRNNEQLWYSRMKTSVRRHVDQKMRTRNFRARNEIVERGVVTKRHRKGEKPARRGRKVFERRLVYFSSWSRVWKQTRHRLTEINPKNQVSLPIFPWSLNQDAHMAKNADSDSLRLIGSPVRSRRKVVWKDQLPFFERVYWIGLCVSRFSAGYTISHPSTCTVFNLSTAHDPASSQMLVSQSQHWTLISCTPPWLKWLSAVKSTYAPIKPSHFHIDFTQRFSSEEIYLKEWRKNWARIVPWSSPRAHGTTSNFGKERVHREASFKRVNLLRVVLAHPGLRRCLWFSAASVSKHLEVWQIPDKTQIQEA